MILQISSLFFGKSDESAFYLCGGLVMFIDTVKDVLMLGFAYPVWESFLVEYASRSHSRGCRSCAMFVVALCLGFFHFFVDAASLLPCELFGLV